MDVGTTTRTMSHKKAEMIYLEEKENIRTDVFDLIKWEEIWKDNENIPISIPNAGRETGNRVLGHQTDDEKLGCLKLRRVPDVSG